MKTIGNLPEFVGDLFFSLNEVMYWLYLPVSIDYSEIRVPESLRGGPEAMIELAISHSRRVYKHDYRYIYLSARKGWATPDNPLNRPGWHCDGYGTDDLNYVWWDGAGTRFAHQHFEGIVSDHNRALKQFDEQVDLTKVVTYAAGGVFCLDPTVVHATPVIEPPGHMRQYVKVSMSDHQYNLENNSHNYLFDYSWPMHSRNLIRNSPHAQRDYV